LSNVSKRPNVTNIKQQLNLQTHANTTAMPIKKSNNPPIILIFQKMIILRPENDKKMRATTFTMHLHHHSPHWNGDPLLV